MESKHYIILVGCLLTICVTLIALYAFSPLNGRLYQPAFERKFAPGAVISQKAVLNLKDDDFYIAGTANKKIYLGNFSFPFLMGVADTSLDDLQLIQLQIKGIDTIENISQFRLRIDSPYFFLFNGTMPVILRGRMDSWVANNIMPDGGFYFTQAEPLSHSSFALRSHITSEQSFEMAKLTLDSPYFKFEKSLLQKQMDGIFCLGGQLNYSKEAKKLVYHHFFKNELVVADSNLNLIFRGHTIDTFSRVQLRIETMGDPNKTTLSAPSFQVNTIGKIFKDYLMINSNLPAKNEDMEQFANSVVIDIYNLSDGAYINSFYIPYYRSIRPNDFLILDHFMVAMHKQYLVIYNFM